jgi:hypothetical protein
LTLAGTLFETALGVEGVVPEGIAYLSPFSHSMPHVSTRIWRNCRWLAGGGQDEQLFYHTFSTQTRSLRALQP